MRGMESGSIDLIYLDPPFNSKHDYSAPIGSKAAGAAFKDTWALNDIDVAWWGEIADAHPALYKVLEATKESAGKSMMSYMINMGVRIIEMRRILKNDGSLYLHCDPTASHYLKIALDSIFGHKNFKNEISWKRSTSGQKGSQHATKKFGHNRDVILLYSRDSRHAKFNPPKRPLTKEESDEKFNRQDPDGRRWKDDSAHIWRTPGMGARPNLCYEWRGFQNPHPAGWRLSKERLEEEYQRGNFEIIKKAGGARRLIRKVYESDYAGENIGNLWDDILPVQGEEDLKYPTQKPLQLLERIIEASSNEGEMVLDPFCGCATACSAAEKLGRKWIGIDISAKAYDLVRSRLRREAGIEKFTKGAGEVIHRVDIPRRKGTRSPCLKDVLYGRQGGNCNGCGEHFRYQNLTMDHVVPRSKGGPDADDNMQLLCGHCNSIKGGRLNMAGLKTRLMELGVGNRNG